MSKKNKKKKNIEKQQPLYEITLNFTNNLLQTFLINSFEKSEINLSIKNFDLKNIYYQRNMIRVKYKDNYYYIIFQTKDDYLQNIENSTIILDTLVSLLKLTEPNNINIILYQVNFNDNEENHKKDFMFFVQTNLHIKCLDIVTTSDLLDFIYNFIEILPIKEEKRNLTFIDSKPINLGNGNEIQNMKNIDFIKNLMCINGISEIKAVSIVKNYPSLKDLYNFYLSEEYNENEKENLLTDIKVEYKSKENTKKIGQVLSKRIYDYYMSDNPDLQL